MRQKRTLHSLKFNCSPSRSNWYCSAWFIINKFDSFKIVYNYLTYFVLQISALLISNYTATIDYSDNATLLLFSRDFIRTFDIIIHALITPFVCVIGIVLNSVGLSLLRQDSNTNSQSVQFHMLCFLFVQRATLLLGLLHYVPVIIETYDYHFGKYYTYTFATLDCVPRSISLPTRWCTL